MHTIPLKELRREVRTRVYKMVANLTLIEPSQEGSRLDESTVFTFPSGPKKYPNLWPKALKMEARCSQKPLRRGSKKVFKTLVFFTRLWGQNVVQNGAQNLCSFRLLVFLAQSGPTGLSEWILRAKMEPKRSNWEAKLDPMT